MFLLQPDMQRAVEFRFRDTSTLVREAAVDLVGRFVLSRPELTSQYYDMICERIRVSVQLGLFPYMYMHVQCMYLCIMVRSSNCSHMNMHVCISACVSFVITAKYPVSRY